MALLTDLEEAILRSPIVDPHIGPHGIYTITFSGFRSLHNSIDVVAHLFAFDQLGRRVAEEEIVLFGFENPQLWGSYFNTCLERAAEARVRLTRSLGQYAGFQDIEATETGVKASLSVSVQPQQLKIEKRTPPLEFPVDRKINVK